LFDVSVVGVASSIDTGSAAAVSVWLSCSVIKNAPPSSKLLYWLTLPPAPPPKVYTSEAE